MSHRVRRHLRLAVEDYDEAIRRFIPGYEMMLAEAASAVAQVNPGRVLDLGAGTGGLSAALLLRPEVREVRLLDVDPEMLEQARARLTGYATRVSYHEASFSEALPDCDAVAASLALHHVPTIQEKTELYGRIYEALSPDGVLVNADATMPEDEPERMATFRFWADHLVSEGIEESRAWRHFEEWADEDTYFSLNAELAALEAVGFDARCCWKLGPMAVTVGRK